MLDILAMRQLHHLFRRRPFASRRKVYFPYQIALHGSCKPSRSKGQCALDKPYLDVECGEMRAELKLVMMFGHESECVLQLARRYECVYTQLGSGASVEIVSARPQLALNSSSAMSNVLRRVNARDTNILAPSTSHVVWQSCHVKLCAPPLSLWPPHRLHSLQRPLHPSSMIPSLRPRCCRL